jgi:hypothetical protein
MLYSYRFWRSWMRTVMSVSRMFRAKCKIVEILDQYDMSYIVYYLDHMNGPTWSLAKTAKNLLQRGSRKRHLHSPERCEGEQKIMEEYRPLLKIIKNGLQKVRWLNMTYPCIEVSR